MITTYEDDTKLMTPPPLDYQGMYERLCTQYNYAVEQLKETRESLRIMTGMRDYWEHKANEAAKANETAA